MRDSGAPLLVGCSAVGQRLSWSRCQAAPERARARVTRTGLAAEVLAAEVLAVRRRAARRWTPTAPGHSHSATARRSTLALSTRWWYLPELRRRLW
ncbi:hypothetical protein [Mycolicibacterium frederiksbergense]|uniref:hypothetical protein n=1 Tax=Mycolicibacterium frederiksbergense TaxID=117567 RepID=UPI002474D6CB|nr:hypothetical protein [Mycolicibacterium frederiksbergense]